MRKLPHVLTAAVIAAFAFSSPAAPVAAAPGMGPALAPLRALAPMSQRHVKQAHCRRFVHCHGVGRYRYCHRCG